MSSRVRIQKKGSFKRNVIVTFFLITVASLTATGVLSLGFINMIGGLTTTESSQALETQVTRNMVATSEKTALVVNQKLASAESVVRALARECEALLGSTSTVSPRPVYYDYFFEYSSKGPHPSDIAYDPNYGINVSWTYSSWYIVGTDSTNYSVAEAALADRLYRISNIDIMFRSVHEQMPELRWLYVAFTDGLFINYPGSIFGGSDLDRARRSTAFFPPDEPWYQDIVAGNGDIVFVDPYFDPIEQVLMISIGRAIYGPGHQLQGMVAVDIPYNDIRDRILNVQVLESGYAALLLRSGEVVAHPELTPADYLAADAEGHLPYLSDIEGIDATTLQTITSVPDGEYRNVTYTRDGEQRYLVATPVGKGDYVCVAIVPSDEVFAPVNQLTERIAAANFEATSAVIFVTAVGGVLAVAVAVLVANQVTRPLEYLMGLAMRNVEAVLRQEELDVTHLQVDPSYTEQDDEIGELARAFQGMLDAIREDDSTG